MGLSSKSRIKSIQNQSPGPLPPCRPIEFRAPASIWQRAQVVGRAGSVPVPCRLAPTWEAMGLGSRLPLRTGALTARLRKRNLEGAPLCPVRPPPVSPVSPAAVQGPSANPVSTHTPPIEPSTGHRTTSLACLVFSCLLSPCQSSSCHHITSPRIAHRIASQLPSVDVSASRPAPPIDFFSLPSPSHLDKTIDFFLFCRAAPIRYDPIRLLLCVSWPVSAGGLLVSCVRHLSCFLPLGPSGEARHDGEGGRLRWRRSRTRRTTTQ